MSSLYEAFQASARRHGEAIAIRDGDRSISWTELEIASRAAACAMISVDVQAGDRFAIWAVNQWRWVVAALAGQAVGATLVPLSTRLKSGEAGELLRRADVRLLFCDPGFGGHDFVAGILAEHLPELRQTVLLCDVPRRAPLLDWQAFTRLGSASDEELDARIAAVDPEAISDIIFTSGTTGRSKGVPMTHAQSLVACAQQQACVSRFVVGDVFAVTYPFAHNAGYRAGWQAALLYGATVIPVRSYDPLDFLEMIDRERVTVLPAVPTIFQAMLDHPRRQDYDLSSIRLAATGATMIPVPLIERMVETFGADRVTAGYGLTEAAGSVTTTRPGDRPQVIATTVGKPLANLEVVVLGSDGNVLPPGEAGEIAVRGPQVLRGYYQDEAATAEAFTADGFLRTGDVGLFDGGGNLRITDRIKDMYIVGGYNTYPAEIEHRLRAFGGIADAAVIGIDDARLGQVGMAFVVAAPGTVLRAEDVIGWCRETMANYKVPREVRLVDALPLNATGKVSKIALREMVGMQR